MSGGRRPEERHTLELQNRTKKQKKNTRKLKIKRTVASGQARSNGTERRSSMACTPERDVSPRAGNDADVAGRPGEGARLTHTHTSHGSAVLNKAPRASHRHVTDFSSSSGWQHRAEGLNLEETESEVAEATGGKKKNNGDSRTA